MDTTNPYAESGGGISLSAVNVVLSPVEGVARPGHIDVTYEPLTEVALPVTRRIRFPTYENGGHELAAASPAELFEDVREFLCAPETP